MTLFSEAAQLIFSAEIDELIAASKQADRIDENLWGVFKRNYTFSANHRGILETLKTNLVELTASNDKAYKIAVMQTLENTNDALKAAREAEVSTPGETEQGVCRLQHFTRQFFKTINDLKLADISRTQTPMCELHYAVIRYVADRELGRAVGLVPYPIRRDPERILRPLAEPFLNKLDLLIKNTIGFIQANLRDSDKTNPSFQAKEDALAQDKLRSLELELAEAHREHAYLYCSTRNLDHYLVAAQGNIVEFLMPDDEADEALNTEEKSGAELTYR